MIKSSEIAFAMGKSVDEFEAMLPALKALGFPEMRSELGSYDVSEVLSWVLAQQDTHLAITSMLAEKLLNSA